MNSLSSIGHITLNISFVLYLIFYLPQLIHNFKKNNIQELSLLMHLILCVATIADLIYGFGRHMQWQYRLVTIISLLCLTLQHWQICYYQKFDRKLFLLSISLAITLLLAVVSIYTEIISAKFAITAGTLAPIGYFTFTIPQIIKNYRDQTTIGISIYFVLISVSLNLLDTISAWTLQWDWPSKIGSPLALLLASILLRQFWTYKPKSTGAILAI